MSGDIVDSYDPRVWARGWTPSPVGATDFGKADKSRLPVGLAAAAAILLLGTGIAWLSRPANDLPAPVAAASRSSQPVAAPDIRRTLVLSRAADLEEALTASGLAPDLARQVSAAAAPSLSPTGEIRAVLSLSRQGGQVQLQRLEASNADSSGVIVSRSATGEISASRVASQVSTRILVAHGTMDGDSFYSSAIAAGLPNSLIPGFAKALAFDFDFQREVAAGDAFEAAYAQPVNASGEPLGAPTLLYASLTTGTKSAAVYRFAEPGKPDEWFDASGRSIVRALMRTPVDGARVSSKFGYRIHPVLGFMKLHGGIDFAAPIGTPIYASGNGTVQWAAMKGANGNLVILQHDNGWQTYYLHMNRFGQGISAGVRVAQGQQIGEVGTTGRSTGPHLHYEVHIDGEKVDPATIQTEASGQTLAGPPLIAFEKIRDQIDVSRAAQAN